MSLRDATFNEWWPATQSLDLIAGDTARVARAVHTELLRVLGGETVRHTEAACHDFGSALSLATDFTNVPTLLVVVPTHSKWSALWCNSFLCDGYDSLCYCLTMNHGLTTMHWSAHDSATTFQAGASFTYRTATAHGMQERSVYAGNNDGRWTFAEAGPPLPEEDVSLYKMRRKRDRLNEVVMQSLLARLGARPWRSEFYALPGRCHVLSRPDAPRSIVRRTASSVRGG